MASDDAAISTNDDASQCKRYAVEKGYWTDPYISLLTGRPTNIHTPEINRGYYARVKGIRLLLEQFLRTTKCECQIINLGAGFDTTFWLLKDQGLAPKCFVDIDFPTVTSKKCHFIKSRKSLLQKVINEDSDIKIDKYDLHGSNYHLVGANLRNLNELDSKLSICGVDRNLPTIFLAECVLIYMEVKHSSALLQWITDNFMSAFFINYEQVHMNDKFGQIMIDNLKARQCSLPGVMACISVKSQTERFLNTGWQYADIIEMNHVYECLPQADVQRIENLEFLDERELLDQLLAHYCIGYAYKDPNSIGFHKINFSP